LTFQRKLLNSAFKMCVEVTQTCLKCWCTVVRHLLCLEHIEHTRLQIDDKPCPNLQVRLVQTKDSECGRLPEVPCINATHYTFATFPRQSRIKFNVKWCEVENNEAAKCWDGKMHYTQEHECGFGLTHHKDRVQQMWRHVLPTETGVKQTEIVDKKDDTLMEGLDEEVKEKLTLEDVKMEDDSMAVVEIQKSDEEL